MRRYEVNVDVPIDEVLELAHQYVSVKKALFDALSNSSRLVREYASQALLDLEREDWKVAKGHSDVFIDALHRPEAPTRYNSLEVIGILASHDMRLVDQAWDGIEECLYDEESGAVRLAAFRVFTAYGASTTPRSKKAWLLISDALRCYHGDPEFITMLNEFIAMLKGNVDDSVRKEAGKQFAFNAENATGLLKRKSEEIASFANPRTVKKILKEHEKKALAITAPVAKKPTTPIPPKKEVAPKPSAKKTPAKKAEQKPPAKKASVKKAEQKPPAKKAPAQKAEQKPPTKKAPAKKASVQKEPPKNVPAKKTPPTKKPTRK